jgi:hypothetical protein
MYNRRMPQDPPDWTQIFDREGIPETERPAQLSPLPPQQISPSGRSVIEATRDPSVIRFALRALEQRPHTPGLARHRRVLGAEPFDPWLRRPRGTTPTPFSAPWHLIWREITAQLPPAHLSVVDLTRVGYLDAQTQELRRRLQDREDMIPLLARMRLIAHKPADPLWRLLTSLRHHRDLGLSPQRVLVANLGLARRKGEQTIVLAHPGPSFRVPLRHEKIIFEMPERPPGAFQGN